MVDETKTVERNVSSMILDSVIVLRGIVGRGTRKGEEYATLAISRDAQWKKSLADLAEDAGCPVIDLRKNG